MKNIKQLLLAGWICLAHTQVFAQISPLHEGMTMPGLRFQEIYNYTGKTLRLDSIRKKLIILDFWDFSCRACLESFAKIDSMQQVFREEVQFILVNKQSASDTRKFLAKRKLLTIPRIPFICGDTLLAQLFPHQGKPFHVWLDSTLTVRYLIDGYNTTFSRIAAYLREGQMQVLANQPVRYLPGISQEVFADQILYQSLITRCLPAFRVQPPRRTSYFQLVGDCYSVEQLLCMAFNEGGKYQFERPGLISFETEDVFRYRRTTDYNLFDSWRAQYAYNYHLQVPEAQRNEAYRIAQQDICRYFGLDVVIERRRIPGISIDTGSGISRLQTRGGEPIKLFYQASKGGTRHDSLRVLRNMPYTFLSKKLSWYLEHHFGLPVQDPIRLPYNIDISLPGTLLDRPDFPMLQLALAAYGIILRKQDIEMDVLVVKEIRGQR